MNPPHGDLVLSGVSICAGPNLDIIGEKFNASSHSKIMCVVLFLVYQRIGILKLAKLVFVGTSVTHCYYAFVLLILEYYSPVWGSPAECLLQLLERQVYSVARLRPDQRSCHCIIYLMLLDFLCCTRLIRTLFVNELPSVSTRIRHTRAAAAAHALEFVVSRCRKSQFARCFLRAQVRIWNDLPCTVFGTGTLDSFN